MVWLWAVVAALLVVVVATLALRRRGGAGRQPVDEAPPSAEAPSSVAPDIRLNTAQPAPASPDPATEIALEAAPEPPPAIDPDPDPEPEPAPAVRGPSGHDGPVVPPPSGFAVKGNVGSMLFHTPDSPYFARTRAEVWFNSEEAAREAGFRRWDEA